LHLFLFVSFWAILVLCGFIAPTDPLANLLGVFSLPFYGCFMSYQIIFYSGLTCSLSRKLIFSYFVGLLHSAPMVRMNALIYATCFADASR
jgi:hypothetical protein